MTIDRDRRKIDPDLSTILDRNKEEAKSEINCVTVGTIESFDSGDQTVTVSINYKRYVSGKAAVSYPVLIKCPVMFLFGDAARITFPIVKGDTCLLLFCDREIDTWFSGGAPNVPQSARMHSLNDAVAIVGIRNLQNKLSDYYDSGVEIKNGESYIRINNDGTIVISGLIVSINP